MHDIKSWVEEKRSEYLYSIVANNETDETKKKLFHGLGEMAKKQAHIWEKELKKEGKIVPATYYPDTRTRIVGNLLRYFSIRQLRFILSAMKVRGMSTYGDMVNHHTLTCSPTNLEGRHKGLNTAGNLRAAVFGINDGLVSNMSLLLGVVGGGSNSNTIILSGIAGLLAGACSMAAGEYVSMRSQREFFEYQIALEKEELEFYPEEEAAELAHIYKARGLPDAEAKELADRMISNPERALDTLAREELGLNPSELGSPLGAAVSSFFSFAVGAFIPLMPFLFSGDGNILISMALTGCALFCVGAILSLYTNRSAMLSGLRMLIIGAAAGGVTYLIGKVVGISLA